MNALNEIKNLVSRTCEVSEAGEDIYSVSMKLPFGKSLEKSVFFSTDTDFEWLYLVSPFASALEISADQALDIAGLYASQLLSEHYTLVESIPIEGLDEDTILWYLKFLAEKSYICNLRVSQLLRKKT